MILSMNGKTLIIIGIAGGIINGIFWFAYMRTENIIGSIGFTTGAFISIIAFLYMLGKLLQLLQQNKL